MNLMWRGKRWVIWHPNVVGVDEKGSSILNRPKAGVASPEQTITHAIKYRHLNLWVDMIIFRETLFSISQGHISTFCNCISRRSPSVCPSYFSHISHTIIEIRRERIGICNLVLVEPDTSYEN